MSKLEVISTKRTETSTHIRVKLIVKNFQKSIGQLQELASMNEVPDKAWFDTFQPFYRSIRGQDVVIFSWYKPFQSVIKDI